MSRMSSQERRGLATLLSLFAMVAVVFASLLLISVLDIADVGPNFRTGTPGPNSYLIRAARIDTVVSTVLFVAAMGSMMTAAVVWPGRGRGHHIVTAAVSLALLPLGVVDFLALAVAF